MTQAVSIAQSGSNNTTFRNRIINGAMTIDQRNAGASVAITSNYTLDRWKSDNSNDGTLSAQQVIDAPTGLYNSLKLTVGTADTSVGATQYAQVLQLVEGLNTADLGWGASGASTVTLSFWVKSSVTGTFGGVILNSALNRSYVFSYNINSAGAWEQKSVTIPGDTSGTWLKTNGVGVGVYFNLMCGSTYQGSTGSWSSLIYLGPTGQTNLLATSGNTWQITGVQLEKGSTATPFEQRLYGTELALCRRYFRLSPTGIPLTVNTNNTYMRCQIPFDTPMRASPSVLQTTTSVYGIGGPNTSSDFNSTNASISSLAADANGIARIELNTLGASPVANGYYSLFTSGKFAISAEL